MEFGLAARFPLKVSVIPFSSFLSLTSVCAAAVPGHPWPPLDRGSPIKVAFSLLYLKGAVQAKDRVGSNTYSHPPILPLPSFPSWILFDEKNFEGEQYILSEGEFPTLTAMGCLASTVLGSLRKVPLVSAPVPGIPEAEVSLPLPTAD